MNDLIVPIGVPVTIICLVFVGLCVVSMVFSFGLKYPKVQRYTLDQQWDREPLLFSATEIEPMSLARHASATDVDGASANGKW